MTGSAGPLPAEPPRPWRHSVKVLLSRPDGRVLLLRCVDPGDPDQPPWWELPGGGQDPGEEPVDTAVREVAEETGLVVDRAAVGPALATGENSFTFGGRWHFCSFEVRVARVPQDPPTVPLDLQDLEPESILDQVWLLPEDLEGPTWPTDLRWICADLLAGRTRALGYTVWDGAPSE